MNIINQDERCDKRHTSEKNVTLFVERQVPIHNCKKYCTLAEYLVLKEAKCQQKKDVMH